MKKQNILIVVDSSRACGKGILLGISKYCNFFTNWELFPQPLLYIDPKGPFSSSDISQEPRFDAVITEFKELADRMIDSGIPLFDINVQEAIPRSINVVADDQKIAQMAFDYFTQLQFKNLAYCGFAMLPWSVQRGCNFQMLAKSKNMGISTHYVSTSTGRFSWSKTKTSLIKWLKNLPRPAGLLACNDDCAKLVYTTCKSLNIRIPNDISILGVDNDEVVCLPLNPPLSSLVLDFESAGFHIAETLDKILKKKISFQEKRIVINTVKVVERRSTCLHAVDDAEVTKALEYIQKNIHRNICVEDVVQNAMICRRSLECRFKKSLHTTIYGQIRKVRVQHICKLLVESNLSISQIAYHLGFTGPEHVSRYFRAEKKMSAADYRRRNQALYNAVDQKSQL